MPIPLYERLGGQPAIRATVTKLYQKILHDPELAAFFRNIDIDRLRHSQTAFVSHAFGAPSTYQGKSLRDVHAKAVQNGLSDKHFDRVVLHLRDAMTELNIPESLIQEALAIVASTKQDVLNR